MHNGQLEFHRLSHPPFAAFTENAGVFPLPSLCQLSEAIMADIDAGNHVIGVRGGPGAGKTCFTHVLASRLESALCRAVLVAGASSCPRAVQRTLGQAAGLHDEKPDPARLFKALQAQYQTHPLIVIVDGAESLAAANFHYFWQVIELCRLKAIRLHLVLVGDLGGWPGLNAPGLTELRRAAISSHMVLGLTADEALDYLDRKLQQSGRRLHDVMAPRAAGELIGHAGGVPAQLNACADAALDYAYAKGSSQITPKLLREALSIAPSPVHPLRRMRDFVSMPAIPAAAAVAISIGGAAIAFIHASDAPPSAQELASQSPSTPYQQAAIARGIPAATTAAEPARAAPSLAAYSKPSDAPSNPPPAAQPPRAKPDFAAPAMLETTSARPHGQGLVLIASAGDSIADLYKRVYRGLEPPPYTEVEAANRAPIRQGSLVVFPEPPHGWNAH